MRTVRRIGLHVLIVAFLLLQTEAFLHTMFRQEFGIFPWRLTRYFYALMAPYPGYKVWNYELVAEGKKDGEWRVIDLLPYYPGYTRGQRNTRNGMISVYWQSQERNDPGLIARKYGELAISVQSHEAEHGNAYDAVRIWREDWPMSPNGYEALRLPQFSSRVLLGQTP